MDFGTGLIHKKELTDYQGTRQAEHTEKLIQKLGFKLSQINWIRTETPDYEEL
jgi:hypothetical protein